MRAAPPSPFSYGKTFIIGFGFLGISLLWSVYNDFVPILLQAGRPDFSKGAGIEGFGLGIATTGLVMGLDNFAALFILPYIGGVSDRIFTKIGRRKPFILIGAPIAAVAFAAAPFLLGGPLWMFMAALIVTLLAMDIFRTPVVALMPDLTPRHLRSQANGIINFMGGLGGVIAGLIGGALFGVSPVAPFLLGAGGMLVSQAIIVAAVREPETVAEPDAPEPAEAVAPGLLPGLMKVVRDRNHSTLLLLGGICFWFLGQSAFDSWFTSYSLQRLGLETGQAVQLKSVFSLAVLASALPCGLLGAKLGRRRGILLGLALLASAIAMCFFVVSPLWMRPLLAVGGFGWMMVVVNSLPLVLDFAPEGRIGTYTGMYYLASQTASFLGPVVSGRLFEVFNNEYALLTVYSPLMLLTAFALVLGVRPPAPKPPVVAASPEDIVAA